MRTFLRILVIPIAGWCAIAAMAGAYRVAHDGWVAAALPTLAFAAIAYTLLHFTVTDRFQWWDER